ncbi:MAG: hypothetical protein GY850_43495 [bacterium]|nr:hypothetical protein [bacterium]
MKFIRFSLLCAFIVVSACSTTEHFQKKYNTDGWSSSEPLSIPYAIRLGQFERNNLVANSSFEQGFSPTGTAGTDIGIKSWDIIGQNVSWVDRESLNFTNEDVNTGRHAVKIIRETANELDEADGIISDYIEVIPGNYYFSYNIKLKSVASNKYRLGVQLYDAVVIRVLFFDEDKQPIEPGIYNPVGKTLVDNSDKGFSFTNFWTIDDFPWAEVRGRTYNYPFSEGDLPERTRYVRVFFGLKGTGAMWIDDIVYRYSKWNFTTLERLKPYIDRPLTPAQRIIPTPKRFQQINDITFYDPGVPNSALPVIVLPQNPAPAELSAAKILREKISGVLGRVMPSRQFSSSAIRIFKNDYSLKGISNSRLVFSIGRSEIYQKAQPSLPLSAVRDNSQGYVIKAARVGNARVVFLYGVTPLASYYAAATAIQLFETDQAIYHNATVVDYPDFLGRSYVFKNWKNSAEQQNDLNAMSRLSLYKLNKVYLGFNRRGKKWQQTDDLFHRGIKDAGQWCRESGLMSLAMMVNPYSHLGFEPSIEGLGEQLRYTWTHGSPQSLAMLKNLYKPALNAGAETIMLLSDDSVPHTGRNRQNYSLYTAEDKARFVTLQNAQAHVINKLKQWLDSEYPGTRLEYCPPWYSNEHIDRSNGKAENYFHDLVFQIPQDVAIIWTGPTIRSLSIDMADLHRYRTHIGRWPMLWDNTLYARNHESPNYGGYPAHYPGKVRMCNLFEPYDTYRPNGFQKYSDGRQMYTNGAAYSEVYRIKYATVADYEWNTSSYNPELSLWKVLVKNYGLSAAEQLLGFNDAYYAAFEMCLRLKTEGNKPEFVKTAEKFLKDMHDYWTNISAQLPDQTRLLEELRHYLKKQEKRLAEIVSES